MDGMALETFLLQGACQHLPKKMRTPSCGVLFFASSAITWAHNAAIGLAALLITRIDKIPFVGAVLGQFPPLRLPSELMAAMMGVAILLGLAAGFVPAWSAYRARIVDTLRSA